MLTNITRNYVPDWGIQEAIRELVQNALDQGRYTLSYDNGSLIIHTESTLPVEALYMGESSKRGDDSTIGNHGEGLKLALLVLTRNYRAAVIRTDTFTCNPAFALTEHGVEVLDLLIDDPVRWHSGGTSIEFALEEYEWNAFQQHNMLGDTPFGPLLAKEHAHKLYVNGLLIGDTTYTYGYNFRPQQVKLERDRRVADMNELEEVVAVMWCEEPALLPTILQGVKEDLSDFNGLRYITDLPVWLEEAVVAEVPPNARSLSQQWGGALGTTISNTMHSIYARSSRYVPPQYKKKPHQLVAEFLEQHKSAIHYKQRKKFNKLIEDAKKWQN